TTLVEGVPLGHDERPPWGRIASELACFLARLHEPALLARVGDVVPGLVDPRPQATTDVIRSRLPAFLDGPRADQARRWCAWVDEILASPSPQRVLAHG